MNITVLPELLAYIDPLTPDEHAALERSILSEGCRDALVLWGEVLVDGHNRYGICQQHGLPFKTVQNPSFRSMDDVHLWMIDQHLGRRSVSDFQRGVLALRKKDILAARVLTPQPEQPPPADESAPPTAAVVPPAPPLVSREAVAKAARISSNTVVQIEKIQKSAAPELVAAVKSGTISINAAAAVAALPSEEQVAAVAGGKKELQLAARRVREAKVSKPRAEAAESPETPEAEMTAPDDELDRLRESVAALQAENAALRQQLAALGVEPVASTAAG
jgi:hypothetical protein